MSGHWIEALRGGPRIYGLAKSKSMIFGDEEKRKLSIRRSGYDFGRNSDSELDETWSLVSL